ncbi:MAG: hypothetical protein HY293_18500, partial [Planctomycetes bacterium]|nr:hypothetical protein [Planctomycetota bacterium]
MSSPIAQGSRFHDRCSCHRSREGDCRRWPLRHERRAGCIPGSLGSSCSGDQCPVSTLGVALIPRIAKLEAERGAETAQMLASKVLVGLTGFLVGLATVLELTAPVLIPLLYPGFDAAKQATTVSAFRILALTIPLSGVAAVWGGLLTLKRRYSIVALAPMMTPLLTLALVLSQGAKSGIIPLALGAFSGSLLETLLLGAAVKRTGYPVLPRWIPHADAEVRPVLKQYAAIAVAALFSSSSLLVDQTMVSSLGPGNLSALSYGSKISGMILSVLSTGLAMVLLPRFSEFAARRNWRELRIHHSTICRQVTMASIAAAIVLAFFSPAIIQFLFERGAFKTSDTLAVSRI